MNYDPSGIMGDFPEDVPEECNLEDSKELAWQKTVETKHKRKIAKLF